MMYYRSMLSDRFCAVFGSNFSIFQDKDTPFENCSRIRMR